MYSPPASPLTHKTTRTRAAPTTIGLRKQKGVKTFTKNMHFTPCIYSLFINPGEFSCDT